MDKVSISHGLVVPSSSRAGLLYLETRINLSFILHYTTRSPFLYRRRDVLLLLLLYDVMVAAAAAVVTTLLFCLSRAVPTDKVATHSHALHCIALHC